MAGGTVPGQFVSTALKKVSAIALTFLIKNNNLCPIGYKILDYPLSRQLV
jgi:hypothetical protein